MAMMNLVEVVVQNQGIGRDSEDRMSTASVEEGNESTDSDGNSNFKSKK